jgi:hypothetical protein
MQNTPVLHQLPRLIHMQQPLKGIYKGIYIWLVMLPVADALD